MQEPIQITPCALSIKTNSKFKQDDFIEFNQGDTSGCGYVKGIAAMPQPIIGATYIVEVETIRSSSGKINLEYSCIPVFEQFMKLVED